MLKGTDHGAHLPRLRKVEGQVRGLIKMLEQKRYCIDILTQFKAVRRALKSLESKILQEHIQHCLSDAIEGGKAKKAETKLMIEEITQLVKKTGD